VHFELVTSNRQIENLEEDDRELSEQRAATFGVKNGKLVEHGESDSSARSCGTLSISQAAKRTKA